MIAAGLALTAAGCGEDQPPGPPEQPGGPLVSYERGGGIAGLSESLTIAADGSATVTVGVDQRANDFRLPAAELERLGRELALADFDAVDEAPAGGVCVDCFGYSLEYEGRTLNLDDLDRPSPPLQELLGQMAELVDANYPPAAESQPAG